MDGGARRGAGGDEAGFAVLVSVDYTEGEPETYLLTLMLPRGEAADDAPRPARAAACWRAWRARTLAKEPREPPADAAVLADGLWDRTFAEQLLALTGRRSAPRRRRRAGGLVHARDPPRAPARHGRLPSSTTAAAHTSMVFGTRFVLRVLRRIEDGPHPDVEIGRFLTEAARTLVRAAAAGRAGVLAAAACSRRWWARCTASWPTRPTPGRYTIDELGRYFERVLTDPARGHAAAAGGGHGAGPPRDAARRCRRWPACYLDSAALHGTAHGRLPPRPGRRPRPGLRARAVHRAVPALAGAVAAQPGAPRDPAAPPAPARRARGRARRRPAAGRPGGRDRAPGRAPSSRAAWAGRACATTATSTSGSSCTPGATS